MARYHLLSEKMFFLIIWVKQPFSISEFKLATLANISHPICISSRLRSYCQSCAGCLQISLLLQLTLKNMTRSFFYLYAQRNDFKGFIKINNCRQNKRDLFF